MEVILLKVPPRKLHCGSLRALLPGKAASTPGSTSKIHASELTKKLPLVDPVATCSGYPFLDLFNIVWYFGLYVLCRFVLIMFGLID